MSDDPPTPDLNTDELSVLITQVDTAIDEIVAKIESGRIRNPEHERVRIKYYRALGYLARTKQGLVESKTLEELEAEVAELKRARENGAAGIDAEA
ncbi:hypothetical protein BRC96_09000 [Halobacteriales archaeon QS_6_64_34]|nr:MAG: hypothetical protein BRC96_09000 [Halobacteriales archaeon QS_6_64_34]